MSEFKRIGSVCIKYGCPGVMHIGVLDATAVIEGDVELGVELFVRDKASPQAAQPVAWQYRVSAGPQTGWSLWHDGKGEEFKDSYQVETRPLYTRADAGEIERLRAELECPFRLARHSKRLVEALLAQLTERDALLVQWLAMFEGGIASSPLSALRELTRKAISSTTKPEQGQ